MMNFLAWLGFRFIGIFIIGLGIDKAMGLAINQAISIETDFAIGFYKVSL